MGLLPLCGGVSLAAAHFGTVCRFLATVRCSLVRCAKLPWPVTKNLIPPDLVPPGPNISKYLDPPELIFQKYIEIYGPPLKEMVPPRYNYFEIYGPPRYIYFEIYGPPRYIYFEIYGPPSVLSNTNGFTSLLASLRRFADV